MPLPPSWVTRYEILSRTALHRLFSRLFTRRVSLFTSCLAVGSYTPSPPLPAFLQGHLPQDKEISGTSFWSPQGPANRDLGWRPRTSSSAIGRPPSPRAASPSSRDEQIRAARRQSVPVVTLSPNRNLRHAPDPNPSSWGGPATGPSSGWPHRAMDGTLIA